MAWPPTIGRPAAMRRLLTALRLFSNTCGAITAEPTEMTTPPSSPSTTPPKRAASMPPARPRTAPLNIGWFVMMS